MALKDLFTGVSSAVRKRFLDNFNRANQSGLGTPSDGTFTDGSLWNILRGSWSISTNAAVGGNNSYPMATQTMPTNDNKVSIVSTSQGAGAALWVTDANNWWAVGMTQEPENCNCTYYYNTSYYYYASNCLAYNAGTYNGSNCNAAYNTSNCNAFGTVCNGTYNTSNCNAFGYACNGTYNASTCNSFYSFCAGGYNGSNCNNYAYNTTNKSTRCSGSWNSSNCNYLSVNCSGYNASNCNAFSAVCNGNYNGSNCNATGSVCNGNYNGSNCSGTFNTSTLNAGTPYYYACNVQGSTTSGPFASCSTCYPQYIRIWQSVAGTISLITQWSVSSTLAAAFKVKTTGTQITTSVYSDSSAVTQIGSDLVYTPTGITITPTFGITIVPSSYNQGYSIDSVEITRN